MIRIDGRENNQLRPVTITRHINKYAEGSVLIETGDTKVICTASVENKLPMWRKIEGKGGWLTAEYSMLPRSTDKRMTRDAVRGHQNGRSLEIQRLIGRALRSVINLEALGDYTITLDCDVVQADGGTRTASITGAFVALTDALHGLVKKGKLHSIPLTDYVAATSVGRVKGELLLDLCYVEDSSAEVDMNIVMTGGGKFVEIQGTGEETTFSRAETNQLLDLAESGISQLLACQKSVLGEAGNW